jgi:GT2 family glycosyltransferase
MIENSSKPPKVAVVILNYNGMKEDYLAKFLPSVYNSTYSNLDLYVADNKSTDNSLEYLRSQGFCSISDPQEQNFPFPRYLIEMDENHWFAKGYNIALKEVQADYYVLLNSDVAVASNWIESIIRLMESDAQVAACQPKIRMQSPRESDRLLFEHAGAAGGWIDKWGYPFCRGRLFSKVEEDTGQYDDVQEIFWASGAALFIRSELFHNIGGFDADYKAHMEEIDLCWRLKRANYKIMVCPESVVWHVGGGTLPKNSPHKTFLNFRNSLATVFKNEKGSQAYKIVFVRLLLDAVAGVRFLMNGEFANIWAIIKAHWSFFMQYGHNKRKRLKTTQLIEENCYKIPTFRTVGVYSESIVWQHFVKGKQTFKELDL